MLLTVPWVWDGDAEHALPEFHDSKLAEEEGQRVIVNRNPAGGTERFRDLAFDGGPGSCLGHAREHFPELYEWELTEEAGRWSLTNRRRDGSRERFENLVFHGGPGMALEMRLFTRGGLKQELFAAGFRNIEFAAEEYPSYGIVFPYRWGHPIIARP